MIVWGLVTILVALQGWAIDRQLASALPPVAPGQDHLVMPIRQRLATGVAAGLIDLGLGGVLVYLRRLWLRRA